MDKVTGFWAQVEERIGHKGARYAMVSIISVVVSQVVLFSALMAGIAATTSNMIAVSIGAIPSYTLNRRWTWGKTGKNHLWKEVVPFWAMALLGLGVSTLMVAGADRVWGTTIAAMAANITAFGLLWVAKFMVLNLVLFKTHHDEADAATPITVC